MRSPLAQILVLVLMASVASASTAVVPQEPSIMSFKEWKNDKISQMRNRYSMLETDYLTKKTTNPKDTSLKALYSELKHAKTVAEELDAFTVKNYFVGYLSQYKKNKPIFEAALGKLDSSEISELMSAYANSLLETSGEGLSTSDDNKKPEAASK